MLNIPRRAWTALLRVLLGNPHPAYAATTAGRGVPLQLLTNPHYKGDVIYRGTRYKGTHHALVTPEVWYQVQSVLTAHKIAAEATQVHDRGSRLIVSNAKNRHGKVYCYIRVLGPAVQVRRLYPPGDAHRRRAEADRGLLHVYAVPSRPARCPVGHAAPRVQPAHGRRDRRARTPHQAPRPAQTRTRPAHYVDAIH
ncbi:recombinase family protein [Micrococcoides hystricis]|uniref:Recombinase family protein n=1 Tax=Micrococcoides hystricis TaxID=1572761 RepID=A0ABV6PC88_9MICC